ncbi:MAG: deoxyribodipyrimidine photolyase, partial [Rhodobacteraceae bacterium]|nr:deoxyribodipyrimidine photolyase [Paracoccaceae bacterium]
GVPPDPRLPAALLITEEDCRIEDFPLATLDLRGAATLAASNLRSPRDVAPMVGHFEQQALADAARRAGQEPQALRAGAPDDLARWAARIGARQIVTPFIPEGPLRDWLRSAEPALRRAGITLCEWQRPWDRLIWPHAGAGFFRIKAQIPAILQKAGLA